MDANTAATLTLGTEHLKTLEAMLQYAAWKMLEDNKSTDDPAYIANREVFSLIWDALYT